MGRVISVWAGLSVYGQGYKRVGGVKCAWVMLCAYGWGQKSACGVTRVRVEWCVYWLSYTRAFAFVCSRVGA